MVLSDVDSMSVDRICISTGCVMDMTVVMSMILFPSNDMLSSRMHGWSVSSDELTRISSDRTTACVALPIPNLAHISWNMSRAALVRLW